MIMSGREGINAHPSAPVCAEIFSDITYAPFAKHRKTGYCLETHLSFLNRGEKTEYRRSGRTDKGMEKLSLSCLTCRLFLFLFLYFAGLLDLNRDSGCSAGNEVTCQS